MIIPLVLGAVLNTVDQLHLPPVQRVLKAVGAPPIRDMSQAEPLLDQSGEPVIDPDTGRPMKDPRTAPVHYELLGIGGFASALVKRGAITLIAMFLVCVGSQMDFSIGRRALKKGLIITSSKLMVAIACGYLIAALTDPMSGLFGLSIVAVIAALSNGNGGLFVALTGEYGNRSDVGAVGIVSLNDGPFFTLLALGLLGERFPVAAFLAVLLPMLVGFALGQWDEDVRAFLKHGERLTIPFFAFALGTTMSFMAFLNPEVLAGGLLLGLLTVLFTGSVGILLLRLFGERSQIAAVAEASTAGNAVQTPIAVATAATAAATLGLMTPERAELFLEIVPVATAQVSISTLTTALLCPVAVIFWDRYQRSRGIEGALETVRSSAAARK